jgi:hypothetical protein
MNKEHDFGLWLCIYSIILNIVLGVAFGMIFWHTFVRSEWNAGWVAARNNGSLMEVQK